MAVGVSRFHLFDLMSLLNNVMFFNKESKHNLDKLSPENVDKLIFLAHNKKSVEDQHSPWSNLVNV